MIREPAYPPCWEPKFCTRETVESLAHRRSTALAGVGLLGLGLVDTLGEEGSVLVLEKS